MEYFNLKEFECKCGCGLNNVDPELITMLNKARGIADIPFVIASGCRCEKHNKEIGGSPTSSHLKGLAVDIRVNSSSERYTILNALLAVGFARIGVAKEFIHVDIDSNKAQDVLWTY